MLKRFISYYKPKPVKRIFITDMICAFLVAVCDLFYPMITRNIINIYVPEQEFQSPSLYSLCPYSNQILLHLPSKHLQAYDSCL